MSTSPTIHVDTTNDQARTPVQAQSRVRYGTACYPCKKRKVKCDNTLPCQTCQKREHPNLCSYVPQVGGNQEDRSAKRQRTTTPITNINNVLIPPIPAANGRITPSVQTQRTDLLHGGEVSSEDEADVNGER
jgi:hypothetical protein